MKILTILVTFLIVCSSEAACTNKSRIKFSFLNGVKTDTEQASASRIQIYDILKNDNNFLKAQTPSKSDLCLSVLYNQTYGILDFVETAGQKLRENQSVPFDWKNVAAFFFNEAKLFALGYTVEEIASLMSDETLMLVNYEEGQTLNDITALAVDSLNSHSLVVVSHSRTA